MRRERLCPLGVSRTPCQASLPDFAAVPEYPPGVACIPSGSAENLLRLKASRPSKMQQNSTKLSQIDIDHDFLRPFLHSPVPSSPVLVTPSSLPYLSPTPHLTTPTTSRPPYLPTSSVSLFPSRPLVVRPMRSGLGSSILPSLILFPVQPTRSQTPMPP